MRLAGDADTARCTPPIGLPSGVAMDGGQHKPVAEGLPSGLSLAPKYAVSAQEERAPRCSSGLRG